MDIIQLIQTIDHEYNDNTPFIHLVNILDISESDIVIKNNLYIVANELDCQTITTERRTKLLKKFIDQMKLISNKSDQISQILINLEKMIC